jgi:hypothetical protein
MLKVSKRDDKRGRGDKGDKGDKWGTMSRLSPNVPPLSGTPGGGQGGQGHRYMSCPVPLGVPGGRCRAAAAMASPKAQKATA